MSQCHDFTCGTHGAAGESFDPAKHCRKCYGAARNSSLAKSLGRTVLFAAPTPSPTPVIQIGRSLELPLLPPCRYEGKIVTECQSCAKDRGHERECLHPEPDDDRDFCTRGSMVKPLRRCNACPQYERSVKVTQLEATPAPRALVRYPHAQHGVVIGSYKWPSLVELQIKLIRSTCGAVPICVSSDHPETAAQVQAICDRFPDVKHLPNPVRIGHTGGDISAFHKAATWGKDRGLQVVAKLSQRFLITRPDWLQDGAADLLASGLSLASQRATGTQRFDLRTEACLLDVATWSEPAILARIRPRKYWTDSPRGLSAETVIYRVLQDLAGEFFLPWSLFGEDRQRQYPGVVWHNSHPVTAYHELAARHGVKLDAGFHCDGWMQDLQNGVYEYG